MANPAASPVCIQLEFDSIVVEAACIQHGLVPTEAVLDQLHEDMLSHAPGLLHDAARRMAAKAAENN